MDLLTAIDKQNMRVITQHMDAGTDPNYVPIPEGMPFAGAHPIHLAVLKADTKILQILLDHGADINMAAKNSDKAPPLSWAAFFLVEEIAAFLVESGADLNRIDAHGLTPLDASNLASRLNTGDAGKRAIAKRIIELLKENGALTSKDLGDK
jgi:ankyrin repeat protein